MLSSLKPTAIEEKWTQSRDLWNLLGPTRLFAGLFGERTAPLTLGLSPTKKTFTMRIL